MIDFSTVTFYVPKEVKIVCIEGSDGAGKSTLHKHLTSIFMQEGYEVTSFAFPGNRGSDISIRDILFKSDMANHRLAAPFLFLADFVYTWEAFIKPFKDDPKRIFLFDRFFPSITAYQNIPICEIEAIFGMEQFAEFESDMKDIFYIYLNPVNFEEHKVRLLKKRGDGDINIMDPETEDEIKHNIQRYKDIIAEHKEYGILGSTSVTVIDV